MSPLLLPSSTSPLTCGELLIDTGEFSAAAGQRYERVRLLGRGSFGTVILARVCVGSCKDLRVIKQIETHCLDEVRRTQAMQEIELLRSLSHPNIIGYYDAFLEGTCLCICMEYAAGGDLAAVIARRREAGQRFSERDAICVFSQLALAVQHLHERRILHRDLKSPNVFMTLAGQVKLGDFGISKVLHDSVQLAETQIGSPYYLAPEICENQPYDFKADVWCLGVILYEMLALEVPFSAHSIAALVLRICTSEPKPVPALYGNATRDLICWMLSKRTEQRPSIGEIVDLPLVRRGIAARSIAKEPQSHGYHRSTVPLALSNTMDLVAGPECRPTAPSRRTRCTEDTQVLQRHIGCLARVGSRSLESCKDVVKLPMLETPREVFVDLAELERLLSSPSPMKKPKLQQSPSNACLVSLNPSPRSNPAAPVRSLSFMLTELEQCAPDCFSARSVDFAGSSITCSKLLRCLEEDVGITGSLKLY